MPFALTEMGKAFARMEYAFAQLHTNAYNSMPTMLQTCASATLENGDTCRQGSWVLTQSNDGMLALCQIVEIVQCIGSPNQLRSRPDVFLVQTATNNGLVQPYEMPLICLDGQYALMDPRVRAITIRLLLKLTLIISYRPWYALLMYNTAVKPINAKFLFRRLCVRNTKSPREPN